MTDSTNTSSNIGQPEVEGHGIRPRFAPAAEVEGHKKHIRQSDDAEAPSDEMTADESRDGSEPEVEGHRKHTR